MNKLFLLLAFSFSMNALSHNKALNNYNNYSPFEIGELPDHLFEIQKKKKWTRNVWSVIDSVSISNKLLFSPYNDFHMGYDVFNGGYVLEKLLKQEDAISFNLWNIMLFHFLKGELTLYSPYNPDWYDTRDNGFLQYPVTSKMYGSSENGTFTNDEKFRRSIINFQFISLTDVSSVRVAVKSQVDPLMDSITSNGNVIYYARAVTYFLDQDITQYKLKENWTIDENGLVLDKEIKAIAPMVNALDQDGNYIGTYELFWLDFNDLRKVLATHFMLLDNQSKKKVSSFEDYFLERKFESKVAEQDSVQVKLKK
jgi:Gliding motility associated protein GldN